MTSALGRVGDGEASASAAPYLRLHLGLPRTGTKFLQWNVFARHPSVDYLGLFLGSIWTRDRPSQFADAKVAELMHHVIGDGLRVPDLERCRQLRDEIFQRSSDHDRVPLLSHESLVLQSRAVRRRRAENLWRVFGNRVRILMVLRSPCRLIESAYGLEFRSRNTRLESGRLWLSSVDEWFVEDQADSPSGYLRFAEALKVFEEMFGREAIRVLLFEDFIEDRRRFVDGVCAHFGISPPEGEIEREASANDSPKAWQHGAVRLLERSVIGGRLFAAVPEHVRWRLNRPYRFGRRARVRLSEANQRRVDELTREGNRWISETFGVEMEGKGYAL